MFKSTINEDLELKVSGFDFSTSFTNAVIQENISSVEYWAPEMISQEEVGDQKFKVDIWAVGILAYSMIDGFTPFYDEAGLESELLSEEAQNQNKIENIKRNILE
jgi:serine/threonine protein kinase